VSGDPFIQAALDKISRWEAEERALRADLRSQQARREWDEINEHIGLEKQADEDARLRRDEEADYERDPELEQAERRLEAMIERGRRRQAESRARANAGQFRILREERRVTFPDEQAS
jgi:hypothetical protein